MKFRLPNRITRKRLRVAWGFLLPNFLGFAVFTAGPVLFSLYMAFTDWSLVKHNELTGKAPSFVGFENFKRLLWGDESRLFWDSFYNTSYLMIGIPIGIAGSLVIALLLNRPIGPKRKSTRIRSAVLAVFLGIATAFSSFLLTNPGPTPTNDEARTTLIDSGVSDAPTPAEVNQYLRHHDIQRRMSKSISIFFLVLGLVVGAGLLTGVVFFRTLFYLPSLLAGIALFLLWKSLYKPTGGAFNQGLKPILASVQSLVTSTPASLWYWFGFVLWIVTAVVSVWLVYMTLRKLREGDFGSGAAIGSILAVCVLASIGGGVGYVLCQLPATARFRTGYAVLSGDDVTAVHRELSESDLGIDSQELDLLFYTLGDHIRPVNLVDSVCSLLPASEVKQSAGSIREIIMAHAEALYAGLTSGEGLQPPKWLVDESWAKPALILMGVWTAVGGANMLLYLAGLSGVPEELYEAAQIDGAGPWRRFWNVTWPQLAPTTFFIVIMSTIGGLQGGFDQARAMTGGKYGTEVLTYYLYNLAFTDEFQLGLASAVAWVMFAMIFFMTIINYRFGNQMIND